MFSIIAGVIIISFAMNLFDSDNEQADLIFLCSLIEDKPYTDCDRYWIIFVAVGEIDTICGEETAGCAYPMLGVIFMEDKPENKDKCGRSILHHELLHLMHEVTEDYAPIHDYERCIMWW